MWKRTTEKPYWEAMEVLPPAHQDANGFLLGETQDHRTCEVTGDMLPRFDAFVQKGKRFYASIRPLTIPEYRKYVGRLMRK